MEIDAGPPCDDSFPALWYINGRYYERQGNEVREMEVTKEGELVPVESKNELDC